MKEVPENIKKLISSNNTEDFTIGMHLAIMYFDNYDSFYHYLSSIQAQEHNVARGILWERFFTKYRYERENH